MRRQPPEGGELYQAKERRSVPKSLLCRHPRRRQRKQLIQLPPLSSPKGGPQRAMIDVTIAYISAAYTPQEEKIHASSHINMRKLGRIVPKDLVNIWHGQQSTDPKWCPTKTLMGLRFSPRTREATPNKVDNQPKRPEESYQALDGALQKVRGPFDSRYRGNKASN